MKNIQLEKDGKKSTYTKTEWTLAWFFVWAMGVLTGVVVTLKLIA